MFEIFLSYWLYTGQTETVVQEPQYKTIEACEAVLPFYLQAANKYAWNEPRLQSEVKYVHATCAKKGSSEKEVIKKILSERFKEIRY